MNPRCGVQSITEEEVHGNAAFPMSRPNFSVDKLKNALLAAFESQRNVKAVEMMIFVVKIGT